MDQRLNGLHNSLAYMGVNAVQPPNLTERPFDPNSSDSKNFYLGDFWLNTADQGLWVLVSLSGNIADWREVATGTIATFSTFHTDNGDATVAANAITFNAVSQAGATVTFSGAGSTVRLNVTTGSNNTTVGSSAGNTTLTGSNNTGFGFNVLHSLTTGSTNTAMGVNAGALITTANQNTLFGANAGAVLTTGGQNTLIGRGVGILMTTGTNNVGVGSLSLAGLTTGTNNTCMGQGAGLTYTTSESNNIVIGAFNNGVLTESGVVRIGSYSGSTNVRNTFVGFQSGNNTYTIGSAVDNTAVGYLSLRALTTGSGNVTIGSSSAALLTTGNSNTCLGSSTGSTLTTGSDNTCVGTGAGVTLTTGSNNTLVGATAGNAYINTESNNIVIGVNTALVGEIGIVRIGNGSITTNNNNTFVGIGCGNTTYTLASAIQNTGVGNTCLSDITTGGRNVAVGWETLASCTTGSVNVAVGTDCLSELTTGAQNVAVGNAGQHVTTGSQNTMIGYFAGDGLTTGSNNLFLGDSAGFSANAAGNSNIYIHNQGGAVENNVMRIGESGGVLDIVKVFILGIRGVTTDVNDAIPVLIDSSGQLGTTSSSIRYKENIKDMGDNSSAIMSLRPVSFNYKGQANKKRQYGLIAEEVQMQIPEIVVYDKDTGQPETVQYQFLPVLLLNELQRLEKRVKELELQLAQ